MRFSVSPVSGNELGAACRLLAGLRPPGDRAAAAERYRGLFSSKELDVAGLFVARDEEQVLRGAIVVQTMPGALGLAWPPVTANRRSRPVIEDMLVEQACRWLQSRSVKVCQAFAGEVEREGMSALERHGFRRVTELVDFRSEISSAPEPASDLAFERVDAVNRSRFEAMLLETFEGSLDCPEATGARTDAELLESYGASTARRVHWFLVHRRDQPIGVVLLDRSDGGPSIELTYLGLAPIFRGFGLGGELVKFALLCARKAGAKSMVLSVDARNHPALRLYQTHGFEASGSRHVFLADLPAIS
jgi:mycothiol synthase